jgi:hypothetical protein
MVLISYRQLPASDPDIDQHAYPSSDGRPYEGTARITQHLFAALDHGHDPVAHAVA